MRILVSRGTWKYSEDVFRYIQASFPRNQVRAEDLSKDPFVVDIPGVGREAVKMINDIHGVQASAYKD